MYDKCIYMNTYVNKQINHKYRYLYKCINHKYPIYKLRESFNLIPYFKLLFLNQKNLRGAKLHPIQREYRSRLTIHPWDRRSLQYLPTASGWPGVMDDNETPSKGRGGGTRMLKMCVYVLFSIFVFLAFWAFGGGFLFGLDPKGRCFGFGCVLGWNMGRILWSFWPSNCSTQIHNAIVESVLIMNSNNDHHLLWFFHFPAFHVHEKTSKKPSFLPTTPTPKSDNPRLGSPAHGGGLQIDPNVICVGNVHPTKSHNLGEMSR